MFAGAPAVTPDVTPAVTVTAAVSVTGRQVGPTGVSAGGATDVSGPPASDAAPVGVAESDRNGGENRRSNTLVRGSEVSTPLILTDTVTGSELSFFFFVVGQW